MSGPVHGYGQANCVGQRGTEATEAWISHVCVSARSIKKRKKWTKRLGGHACSDRALGRFRTYEEPRSIVQSRTIERGVLGTICGRRHGHRGGRIGRAVEGARARRSHRREGMPPHAARFVSLPRATRGCQAGCQVRTDGVSRNRATQDALGVEPV